MLKQNKGFGDPRKWFSVRSSSLLGATLLCGLLIGIAFSAISTHQADAHQANAHQTVSEENCSADCHSTTGNCQTGCTDAKNDCNANCKSEPTKDPCVCGPDLAIKKINDGGTQFKVGQQITYHLAVWNEKEADDVERGNSIVVTDNIPAGFTNLSATGEDWSISLTSTTSPAKLTATYQGNGRVKAGDELPEIVVTGTFTSAASAQVTNIATVETPDDINTKNNTSSDTVNLSCGGNGSGNTPANGNGSGNAPANANGNVSTVNTSLSCATGTGAPHIYPALPPTGSDPR